MDKHVKCSETYFTVLTVAKETILILSDILTNM